MSKFNVTAVVLGATKMLEERNYHKRAKMSKVFIV